MLLVFIYLKIYSYFEIFRVKAFTAEIQSEGKTFALARKQILTQLNEFDYASIPSARLQSYLSASQTVIYLFVIILMIFFLLLFIGN